MIDFDYAVSQIEAVFADNREKGLGGEAVLKPVYAICAEQGWDWFTGPREIDFNRRCRALLSAWSFAQYSGGRRGQLMEGNFAFWVYRADPDCPEEHQALDGLAVPPEDTFWVGYYPPLEPGCGCYVVGARSAAGVRRLNGDPDKIIPEVLPPSAARPSIRQLLGAIQAGEFPPEGSE